MLFQVQSQFSAATSAGEDTLRLINSTMETVDEGLTCFSQAKEVAQNASDTAREAHNVSQEAKKVPVTCDNRMESTWYKATKHVTLRKHTKHG